MVLKWVLNTRFVWASEDNRCIWDFETESEKFEPEAQFGILKKMLLDWSSEILGILYRDKIQEQRNFCVLVLGAKIEYDVGFKK